MNTDTRRQQRAAVEFYIAVVEAIKDAGKDGIPSGHLYATLSSFLTLEQYETVLHNLKVMGLVVENNNVLTASDTLATA
jgi:hypothetical protein